jgi:hypothetical protein
LTLSIPQWWPSNDRPEVPVRDTKANDVFDAFDTTKDESMHFTGKIRKGDGVVSIGPVVAAFSSCLLAAL